MYLCTLYWIISNSESLYIDAAAGSKPYFPVVPRLQSHRRLLPAEPRTAAQHQNLSGSIYDPLVFYLSVLLGFGSHFLHYAI